MESSNFIGKLANTPHYIELYKKILIQNVSSQFESRLKNECEKTKGEEIAYLLKVSSFLVNAHSSRINEQCLRICQATLSLDSISEDLKKMAVVLLDRMSNHPTLTLAQNRNLISHLPNFNPYSSFLSKKKIDFKNTIISSSGFKIKANTFQKEFWESVKSKDAISISAPTASGKSYILCSYLRELENSLNRDDLILFLVPTRALINQFDSDIKALRDSYSLNIDITTMPMKSYLSKDKLNILIFTQERLHIFLSHFDSKPSIKFIFIDEAHKISDSYRGILLQHAITKASNEETKVVYASPFSINPQELLKPHNPNRSVAVKSNEVTVNQNLLHLTQLPRKPQEWDIKLISDNTYHIGTISLAHKPDTKLKRLALIAQHFGENTSGNLVYVNIPSDAEKAAMLIKTGSNESISNTEVDKLIELCKKTIHKKFILCETLTKGIAFHYGNIPQLIRWQIESLFSSGALKYLVCTSTLIEGVNTSCRNIFVQDPKKGRTKPMAPEDFWNLAGRAGRWGKEFQGNIFCIDTDNKNMWKSGVPTSREGYKIKSSVRKSLDNLNSLTEYLDNKTPRKDLVNNLENEYLISLLIDIYDNNSSLKTPLLTTILNDKQINVLEEKVASTIIEFDLPIELIRKNPGVSPYAMKSLYEYFKNKSGNEETLIPSNPNSSDAVESYVRIFNRINKYIAPDAFGRSGRVYMLSLLVVKWMQGYSIARLISDRERYLLNKEGKYRLNTVIRGVLEDVETYARFRAPLYLSCYVDVLSYYLNSIGKSELLIDITDFQLSLEFGVSTKTHLSLISLGLSRTTALEISEYIAQSELSSEECLALLRSIDLETIDTPELVKEEISSLFKNT